MAAKTKKKTVKREYVLAWAPTDLSSPDTLQGIKDMIGDEMHYGLSLKNVKVYKLTPVKVAFTPAKLELVT